VGGGSAGRLVDGARGEGNDCGILCDSNEISWSIGCQPLEDSAMAGARA